MANVNIGDEGIASNNEILRVLAGSAVCGLSGVDADTDITAVYIEAPSQVIGLAPSSGSWVTRTKPEGVRSGPGDVDFTSYSLRKFVKLAIAGNPSVLLNLFVGQQDVISSTPLGDSLMGLRSHLISAHASHRFLGYMTGQIDRLNGYGKVSRMPKRPELVDKYGYDPKYASAALRLGYQGVELTVTGSISLPMKSIPRNACLSVRRGEVDFEEAMVMIEGVSNALVKSFDISVLPPEVDMDYVNNWLTDAHLQHWGFR